MNTRHTPPAPAGKPDVCQPTGSAELAMLDVYMPMMKSAAILSAGIWDEHVAIRKIGAGMPDHVTVSRNHNKKG